MKLPLAYYGDPILRKKAVPIEVITDEIRLLVKNMIETMRAHNGIGIAAPQVKSSLALFITEVPLEDGEDDDKITMGPLLVFINPKIISYSTDMWPRGEGCLSIPGVFGEVIRPISIKVQATDLEGKLFEADYEWLQARAIMHENDHINGVLFIDRVKGKERNEIIEQAKALKKKFKNK